MSSSLLSLIMRNSKDYLPIFYMYSQHEQVHSLVALKKLICVTRSSIHMDLLAPSHSLDVAGLGTAWLDGVEAVQLQVKEHIKVPVYFLLN